MRGEDPRAAAGGFLGVSCVRRAVGTEEEARVVAGCGFEQRLAVPFTLQYGQAVVVRTDAALEDRIAVHQQVLRRDRRGDAGPRGADEIHCRRRRDVLEDDLEPGHALDYACQHVVDERVLAIEYVHRRVGHLAMHLQHEAEFGHGFERGPGILDRGHACVRMRRGARRIKLGADDEAAGACTADLFWRCAIRQVKRHQRFEARSIRKRRQDARTVIGQPLRRRHRRLQVRHHERTREAGGRERQNGGHVRAVPEVQVPVVRAAQRNRRHGCLPTCAMKLWSLSSRSA